MDRKLNARLTHKIDTQANWEKATNFIPLKGEWIIYDKDDTHADIRLKIGDGETNVNVLPFISTGGTGGSAGPVTIYDVEGLLTQEKGTTLTKVWEYSEDLIPNLTLPQDSYSMDIYFISNNVSPDALVGSFVNDRTGETFEITSENIAMTAPGLYNIKHPETGNDYLLVVTSDFNPSMIGLETFDIGTYAVRSSEEWGTESFISFTEVLENVIKTDLLPKPLRIG